MLSVRAVSLSLLFAGCCALLQVALTALVIARRLQVGVGFLDGGDHQLLRRIRAHGNFSETVPMALLLMGLLELRGLGSPWLVGFGIALLLGSLLHAQSLMTNNATLSRAGGMLLTLAAISIQSVLALWIYFR